VQVRVVFRVGVCKRESPHTTVSIERKGEEKTLRFYEGTWKEFFRDLEEGKEEYLGWDAIYFGAFAGGPAATGRTRAGPSSVQSRCLQKGVPTHNSQYRAKRRGKDYEGTWKEFFRDLEEGKEEYLGWDAIYFGAFAGVSEYCSE
jgi:hypothetical protein